MKKKQIVVFLGLCVAATGVAQAQQSAPAPVKPQYQIGGMPAKEEGPRGISLADGISFFPGLKLGYGNDDNLFLNNTNKKSSNLLTLGATGLFLARQQNRQFSLGLEANTANYQDSSADNYKDLTAFAAADLSFSSRSGLRLGANYARGHDPRGSTDRAIADRPDQFNDGSLDALYAFGGNDAKGRFELAASTANKRYRNNRASTASADRDTDRYRGTFFFKVAPKTSLLVEAQQAKYDYLLSTSTLDSKETRYFVGVTWEATAATSGTLKIGHQKKDFDFSSRTDSKGSTWEIGVEWKPLSYSKVDLFSNKSFSESSGLGDLIVSKKSGFQWTHSWSSRVSSTAGYTFTQDDFIGSGVNRKDETDAYSFKLSYKLGRSVELGADFSRTDRDSTQTGFNYRRNQVMFSVSGKL